MPEIWYLAKKEKKSVSLYSVCLCLPAHLYMYVWRKIIWERKNQEGKSKQMPTTVNKNKNVKKISKLCTWGTYNVNYITLTTFLLELQNLK